MTWRAAEEGREGGGEEERRRGGEEETVSCSPALSRAAPTVHCPLSSSSSSSPAAAAQDDLIPCPHYRLSVSLHHLSRTTPHLPPPPHSVSPVLALPLVSITSEDAVLLLLPFHCPPSLLCLLSSPPVDVLRTAPPHRRGGLRSASLPLGRFTLNRVGRLWEATAKWPAPHRPLLPSSAALCPLPCVPSLSRHAGTLHRPLRLLLLLALPPSSRVSLLLVALCWWCASVGVRCGGVGAAASAVVAALVAAGLGGVALGRGRLCTRVALMCSPVTVGYGVVVVTQG